MATRSLIGIELDNGLTKVIYCHWDGYPEHNGKLLVENYTSPAAVFDLMELGDLSSLDITPAKCKAYHRDRNEPWGMVEPRDIDVTAYAEVMNDYDTEFIYVYNKDFEWECFDSEGNPVEILSMIALN